MLRACKAARIRQSFVDILRHEISKGRRKTADAGVNSIVRLAER